MAQAMGLVMERVLYDAGGRPGYRVVW